MDKVLDLIYKPVALVGGVSGRMTKTQKLASGGAVAVVGGGVSMTLMALAVPVVFMALLFLPLTLMGGVSGVARVISVLSCSFFLFSTSLVFFSFLSFFLFVFH